MHDSFQIFNKDDSSPISLTKKENIPQIDVKKNTYIDDATKIFIKFLSKEIKVPNEESEKDEYQNFLKKIQNEFPLDKLLLNYRKHRVFYTYENYLHFISLK